MDRPKLSSADRALMVSALSVRGRDVGNGRKRAPCPLCERLRGKADHKLALYLHADGGWTCFRCGATGWLDGSRTSYGTHVRSALRTQVLGDAEWTRPPEGFTPLFDGAGVGSSAFSMHRAYLDVRGVSPEIARLAGLGACPTGRLAWHLIAPVFREDPEALPDRAVATWNGWVARDLFPEAHPGSPLYREPRGVPKGTFLYRQHALAIESSTPVYVVEGVFDALALWPDGVATLGKTTGRLFELLCGARRPVVFVPDGDVWAQGDSYAMALRAYGVPAGSVRLPPRCDPDEVAEDVLRDAGMASLTAHYPVPVCGAV